LVFQLKTNSRNPREFVDGLSAEISMISALFLYVPMLLSGFELWFVHRKKPVFLADFSAKRIRTVFPDFSVLLMVF